MRIGHFYRDYLASGGVPSNCRALTSYQARLGHDIYVYAHAYEKNKKEKVPDGVKVREFTIKSKLPFAIPKELCRVLKENQDNLDILHIHAVYIPCNLSVAKSARSGAIPYVVSPDGSLNPIVTARHRFKKTAYKFLLGRPFLNNALGIHALSNTEVEQIRAYGVQSPIFIAPVGVNLDEIPKVEDKDFFNRNYTALYNKDKLVFLGRLDIAQKGLDVLLQGFARVVEEVPDLPIALVLIGPDWQKGRSMLEVLAGKLDISDRVFFLGPIYGEDKFRALTSSDLLVHPAQWEELPRSVREALAVGCPVMVTKETNIAELVEQYQAGVVTELTVESIAKNILFVIGDKQKLARMKERARTLVEKELNWTKIAQTVCEAYEKLLKEKAL